MKIGIITLPLDFNYGGILQAYALEEVLRRRGHIVEHIEVRKQRYLLPLKSRYLVYAKRFVQKYVQRKPVRVFQETYLHETYPIVTQHTRRFIDTYLSIRYVNSYKEIKESDYDALVVGSDQIWRGNFLTKSGGYAPFFDFAKGWHVKRVAYACSFATSEWTFSAQETQYLSELANSFDIISVREASGVQLCMDHLGAKAVHVLDPTMLLQVEDYIKLIDGIQTESCPGNLMCYVLDENEEKKSFIQSVASKYQMTPFRANSKAENRWAPAEERIQPPVEQWLRGFRDADCIITDSFHACVFSIIFNKPFICLGNSKRGADRFTSLLSLFGLEDRLIADVSCCASIETLMRKPDVYVSDYCEASLRVIHDSF